MVEHTRRVRISFDIGGVVSRHPDIYIPIITALSAAPSIEVFVLTDMPVDRARSLLAANGLGGDVVDDDHLLCADWSSHGEACKAVLIDEYGIDMHIDDIPSYTTGV